MLTISLWEYLWLQETEYSKIGIFFSHITPNLEEMTALVQWFNNTKTDFLSLSLISGKTAVITPSIIFTSKEEKRDKGKLVSYLIVEG